MLPDWAKALVEKLKAAGVNTVESLADMTPEQLEAIEGIGPKTVEKISIAVNNYFASLDGGEAVAAESGAAEPGSEVSDAVAEADSTVEAVPEAASDEVVPEASASEAGELTAEAEPAEMAASEETEQSPAEEEAQQPPAEEAPEDKQS